MSRVANALVACTSAAALFASVNTYVADQRGRISVDRFIAKYDVVLRRPEIARTAALVPAPDWAASIMADVALRDAYETINLTDATPRLRELWINAASHTNHELIDARNALLDSIARRPGWPYYQTLLGQTVFTIESRNFDRALVRQPASWAVPMRYAAEAASSDVTVWRSVAAAYLKTWPVLATAHADTAAEVFGHAFSEPYFVAIAFPDAARLLGGDSAVRYIPDIAPSLRVAYQYFDSANDAVRSWQLRQRWERAEWRSRSDDLSRIEQYAKRNDVEATAVECERWVANHTVWDFDTGPAHEQAARVLDLWPALHVRSWTADPFADVARYLLTRNTDRQRFAALVAKRIASFPDVPLTTLAEAKLEAGDVGGAERVALTANDGDAMAWSHYRVALAKRYFDAGAASEAGNVLRRLPSGVSDTHEFWIARGGHAYDDPVQPFCGAQTDIPLHGANTTRPIILRFRSNAPTIVDVAMNGARTATILVSGTSDLPLQLSGWEDKIVSVTIRCGDRAACVAVAHE